jgi:outer membrane autotransporter protein
VDTWRITVGGPNCPDSGKLLVGGHATIEGDLTLASFQNFRPSTGQHWTILVANGGLSGTFSQIIDTLNTSGLTRADIYAPNGFITAYLPSGHGVLTLRSAIPIPLNDICDVNAVLVNALAPNANQLGAPFDIWFSLAQQQRFNLQNHFDDIMAAPAPAIPTPPPAPKEVVVGKGVITGKEALPPSPVPEKRWNVWATGYGSWQDLSSEGMAKGYNYTTGGVTGGADIRLFDHYIAGIMGGYAHTWTDLKPGDIDINAGWGGIYLGYYNKGAYILGAVYGGGSSFDTSRATVVGSRANGSSDTQQWSTFVSIGYDWRCGGLVIGPTFSAQYSSINMNSFVEHGFAPLRVNETSHESWRTDLGFRCWYTAQIGKIGIRPFVRAAWQHEYRENGNPIPVTLVDILGATPVTVAGPSLGADSCTVNAGVSVQWNPTISTYISYDGQLGRDNFDSNGVSGGINIRF